ncbi:MAG: CapA family protein [Candidatus Wildermuthbacteria bacterium]|nr:CapA family protein [Candidatus Wildermuthbacteria bacterium]
MKAVFAFAICCLALVLLVGVFGLFSTMPGEASQFFSAALRLSPQQEPKTVTLLFVGDIMLDRGVEWQIQKNNGDWTWPFQHIADLLGAADLVFGNLESQISNTGNNVGSDYSFRADPASIESLVYAGFDVLSVANNHSFDYTREALEDSLVRLKKAGIAPVGGGLSKQEAYGLVVKEVQNTRIGFLAYTNSGAPAWAARENQSGIAWVDWDNLEEVIETITAASTQVDILIISLHAGEEYQTEPNQFQKAFSQAAIEAGADVLIGHHPHVVQSLVPHPKGNSARSPSDQAELGWIAYSLGNFLFDQDFSQETMKGAILKLIVEDKKIKEISLLQTRLTPSYQVELIE